jgi:hypothetical protein
METKTAHFVHYGDLENFIAETYGVVYYLIAEEECGNDTSISVEINDEMSEWDLKNFNNFLKTGSGARVRVVLSGMVKAGHIPAGHYVIEISW